MRLMGGTVLVEFSFRIYYEVISKQRHCNMCAVSQLIYNNISGHYFCNDHYYFGKVERTKTNTLQVILGQLVAIYSRYDIAGIVRVSLAPLDWYTLLIYCQAQPKPANQSPAGGGDSLIITTVGNHHTVPTPYTIHPE